MPRPASRDDEQGVDPYIVTLTHIAGRQTLSGDDDVAQPLIERECRGFVGGARLDLDKGERAPAPGDDVHFTAPNTGPPCEDAPALQPQVPAGECLGAAPTPFGRLAVH